MEDTTVETVIVVTDNALERIIELRDGEGIEDLTLGLRIVGVGPQGFGYETAFLRPEDVGVTDHLEHHGPLPVAIPQDSVDNMRGAVLDLSGDPGTGLVLRNPNPPSPTVGAEGPPLELEGTPEEKVRQLLDQRINPAIAAHGGVAHLIAVDGSIAKLELGGGCQGCGLAAMTLRQGIETAILDAIPEIDEVVDVTDHSLGENPFYV
jgi:Fe/S biogenesis protein NfuA